MKDIIKKIREYLLSNWRWSILLILVAVAISAYNRDPLERRYITSDGNGYYGYLPAVFIYQDLHFHFLDSLAQTGAMHTQLTDDFRRVVDGGIVNICYVGLSILWIPFFLAAHGFAHLSGFDANGYSTPYQISILLAAIFYMLLGLWAFGRFLEANRIKPWIIAFSLIAMIFATSSIFYIVDEASFTHIYSLSLFSVLLLYAHRFIHTYKTKHLWVCAVTLALIGLIRPTNVIMVAALPVAAGSWEKLRLAFLWAKGNTMKLLLPAIALLGILFIQPLIYYLQTGHFFVWSYQGASFNFGNPQIANILFSYQKGLFVYTPILLLSVVGLWYYFRNNRHMFFWLLATILTAIYVMASWWNWWFGMSFGHRAFIDFYPLFFLAIAYGIHNLKRESFTTLALFISAVLIVFNHIQLEQYRKYIFYYKMDKDMYWRVFLRTSRPYHGILWEEAKLQNALATLHSKFPMDVWRINRNLESPEDRLGENIATGISNSGLFSVQVEHNQLYGDIIRIPVPYELTGRRLAILSNISVFPALNPTDYPVSLILGVLKNGTLNHSLNVSSKRHNQFTRQWNQLSTFNADGVILEKGDTLQAFLWNPYKNMFYWDDFSLFFYGEIDR